VRLNLHLLDHRLAICRLAPAGELPAWATAGPLTSITRAATELSVVCPESAVPEGTKSVTGWRVFQVEGVLDFALTGILASLAQPLAEAGVSLFALSTYNTITCWCRRRISSGLSRRSPPRATISRCSLHQPFPDAPGRRACHGSYRK